MNILKRKKKNTRLMKSCSFLWDEEELTFLKKKILFFVYSYSLYQICQKEYLTAMKKINTIVANEISCKPLYLTVLSHMDYYQEKGKKDHKHNKDQYKITKSI